MHFYQAGNQELTFCRYDQRIFFVLSLAGVSNRSDPSILYNNGLVIKNPFRSIGITLTLRKTTSRWLEFVSSWAEATAAASNRNIRGNDFIRKAFVDIKSFCTINVQYFSGTPFKIDRIWTTKKTKAASR
jgi:hypothetical protein